MRSTAKRTPAQPATLNQQPALRPAPEPVPESAPAQNSEQVAQLRFILAHQ